MPSAVLAQTAKPPTPAPTPVPPPPLPTPKWAPCVDLVTECATVSVYADWDNPTSTMFSVAVVRTRSTGATPNNRTIWFLGEGCDIYSGMALADWIGYLTTQGYWVAVPDMRGTGMSSPRLACSDDLAGAAMPSAACAASVAAKTGGVDPALFTLAQASADLNFIISKLGSVAAHSAQYGADFVFGDSFGALWGQRFLALFPGAATRVMLSSFTAPDRYDVFDASVRNPDVVVREVLRYCSADPACNARLTNGAIDAEQLLATLLAAADEGTLPCNGKLPSTLRTERFGAGGAWRSVYTRILAQMAGPESPFALPSRAALGFIPAFLFRLQRCSDADVAAIVSLSAALDAASSAPPQPYSAGQCNRSQALRYNILFNDFPPAGAPNNVPSIELLLAVGGTLQVPPTPGFLSAARALYDAWPKTLLSPAQLQPYPTTAGSPALLVAGDVDTASRFQLAVFAQNGYSLPSWSPTFMRLPMVPHMAFYKSESSAVPLGVSCVLDAMGPYFLLAAIAPCFTQLTPLSFIDGGAASATTYFGTADAWGYVAGQTQAPIPTTPLVTPAPPTPSPPTTRPSSPTESPPLPQFLEKSLPVGAVIGIVAAVVLVAVAGGCVLKRRYSRRYRDPHAAGFYAGILNQD